MIEMRWLTWEEEKVIMPDPMLIQYGKKYEPTRVTMRKLQYRQMIDTTIRAGMWDNTSIAQTAKMAWSEWRDVPEVPDRDMSCP